MALEHKWNGTILTITSDSGTTAADLKGEKGDTGARGPRGLQGERGGGALIEDGVISPETTWSSSGIMDRFAESMGDTGNPVVLNPIPNSLFNITTAIEFKQDGSGDPSISNIRPISGMDAVKVWRCGKNLMNYEAWKNEAYAQRGTAVFENNGITLTATADDCFTDYDVSFSKDARVYLSEGDTITLSWSESTNKSGKVYIFPNGKVAGHVFVDNKNTKSVSYKATTDTKYITFRFGVSNSGDTISYKNIQLELGSTATAYEPYNGDTFSLALGETIYSGSIDVNRGKAEYNYKYIELTGDETWTTFGSGDKLYYCMNTDYVKGNLKEDGTHICSHFPYKVIVSSNTNIGFYVFNSTAVNYIRVGIRPNIDSVVDIDSWKAYLAAQKAAGTPIQIIYELKEPEAVEVEPQEIKAISGTNTLYTDADNLTILGRVDTMYQLYLLAERVAALEAKVGE